MQIFALECYRTSYVFNAKYYQILVFCFCVSIVLSLSVIILDVRAYRVEVPEQRM